jgi:RND family efflux transporter MFP subunit
MTAVAQSWLDIQCGIIPGVTRAVVMRQEAANGDLKTNAIWPNDMEQVPDELLSAVNRVAERSTDVVFNAAGNNEDDKFNCVIASPLDSDLENMGIAAVEISGQESIKTQDVLKILKWGSIWFKLLHSETQSNQQSNRLGTLVELLVGTLEYEHFEAAAKKAVLDIATRLNCERVSLGLLRKNRIIVHAISHTATVDNRSNLTRDIGSAMEESIDQDATITYPPNSNTALQVSFAQEVLYGKNEGRAVCSTPLFSNGKAIGAITFELNNDTQFDKETLELCESVGALLGPVLELKYQNDRMFITKLWEGGWRFLRNLFGFKYFMLKLFVVLFAISFTYLSLVSADYRVRSSATLEAASKQVITAPQKGFIINVSARAGDRVKQDDLLAKFDEKEIRLELLRLKGEFEQYMMERRAGLLESSERAKVAIATAQIKQTDARMRLLNQQLQRAKITAPFDGIIVSGDLEQSLGTPMESGQILFEIAPVDSYRLRIDVDERDIGDIQIGYQGELLLTGLPDQPIPFTVERLLPVSDAREGKNTFQLEASINSDNPLFRPGMEGIAKINIEQRKLISIWFHGFINWSRLQIWYWLG